MLGFIKVGLVSFYQRGTARFHQQESYYVLSMRDLLGFINEGLATFYQRRTFLGFINEGLAMFYQRETC